MTSQTPEENTTEIEDWKEEFFSQEDEFGYSVDTAASGGDLNNKDYVRKFLTPKLHQQLQKAREEERGRVVDEIAYAFSKHRDYELSELHRSDNRKETKEYIAKGIEVFYLEFLRRLDILKAQNHSELDQDKK